MLRNTPPARRAGFTLIELLVVIAIMALLAALVASGVSQVRNAQMGKTTDQTVVKLQQGIDRLWRAVVDQSLEDRRNRKLPQQVIKFCDGDQDRAVALWTYMNLRREFPQTFTEATSPVTLPAAYVLPARATFSSATPAGSLTPQEESAVLLYMILSESSSRGVTIAADDVTQSAQKQVKGFTVFTDAWGTPIGFTRFAQTAELNLPPYAKSGATIKDSLDPQSKLAQNPWPLSGTTNRIAAANAVGLTDFDSTQNKRITVVAAGADKQFSGNPLDGDDHYGYRLIQQGNKGD
jgi:prepilin-type N-terminal cleavage/methylation domain-containing protein